jgi:hypothetical protein
MMMDAMRQLGIDVATIIQSFGVNMDDVDESLIEKFNNTVIGYPITAEELKIALEKVQNLPGPETSAETVISNSKVD